MKLLSKIILLAWSVALINADQPQSPSGPGKVSETKTALQKELAKFDKNKDGTLDAEEQAAYLAAKERKRDDDLKKWDKNGDGKLDEEERAQARAEAKQVVAEARRAEKEAKAAQKATALPSK